MTAAPDFKWTRTNYREQHCRLDGRIVGKIMTTAFPTPPRYEPKTGWDAFLKLPGGLRWIGYRVNEDAARGLVEKGRVTLART